MATDNKSSGVNLCLLATTTAILLWSTSFVATKIAYASFPPLTLGACRFFLASLVLGTAVLAKREFTVPSRRDTGLLALSGLLGITLYFAMENVGVSLTSASNAALIVASYPAITVVLERLCYGTRFSAGKAAGIVLAAFGVYCISVAGNSAATGGDRQLLGNIILAATGIVWAFYNFVVRSVVNKYPPLTVSLYQTVAGFVAFIPLALLETPEWRMPTAASWGTLVYLGLLCSVVAFMLYNYGLRKLSAGTAVMLMNLVPVFGVLFSVLLLGEEVHMRQLAGGLVVIAGVALTVRARKA